MDISTVMVTLLIIVLVLFKLYNIKEKGIKDMLATKIVVLLVFAALFAIYTLFNPEFQIAETKQIILDNITKVME